MAEFIIYMKFYVLLFSGLAMAYLVGVYVGYILFKDKEKKK
jgi:hypothetical protein